MFETIKNFPDYVINKDGVVKHKKFDTILKGNVYKSGNTYYIRFNLSKDNKKYCRFLHRLLSIQYIPNPNNLKCVDHWDGNGLNNSLENLRWGNHSQNLQNQEVNKTNKLGIKNISIYKNEKQKYYKFSKSINKIRIIKSFKTLEEAKEFKKEFYQNITVDREFHVENKRE